jgi:hypothetical protein
MTPARLYLLLQVMLNDPSVTLPDVLAKLAAIKTSALAGTDGPTRAHDVAYYCDKIAANITALQSTAPPWPAAQIKQQIAGRLTAIIKI